MSFTFSKKNSPYEHWEYFSLDNGDYLRIVPERGGLITSWVCNGREMLYLDSIRFKDQSKSIRGGIPVLFPICGKLPENRIFFDNKEYCLKQHGFARDCNWNLNVLDDKSGVKTSLTESDLTLLSFPFKFNIDMEIKLGINSLEIISTVKNNSDRLMPFSFGLHPYFAVKDINHVRIHGLPDDCIDHKDMTKTKTDVLLQSLPMGIDMISGPSKSRILFDLVDKISIETTAEEPFDLTVIWSDPPRKMVCLEPWTSPRNSLINGDRCICILPGQEKSLSCTFTMNTFS